MINDAHCHFFSSVFFQVLAKQKADRPPGDPVDTVTTMLGWEKPGSPEELADRWVGELDRHGVARAALMASIPGDERSVAAAVARHPRRFVGYFMVDPTLPDAPDRARRGFAEHGLQCVCLFPAMHHFRLDSPEVLALVRTAAQFRSTRRTAVFAHCGVLSVGVRKKLGLPSRFDLRLGQPLDLIKAAQEYPELPFVVPHFGAGFFREALMATEVCPNLHFDTSSSNAWIKYLPRLTLGDVLRQALSVVGPDRLLFGTDSSFFPRGWQRAIYDEQYAVLNELGVEGPAKEKILGGNFERVFGAPR